MEISKVIEKIWAEKIDFLEWEIVKKNSEIDNLKRQIFNLEAKLSENQKYNKSKVKNESAREKAELRKKIRELEYDLKYEKNYSRNLYTTCEELITRMWYKHCFWELQLSPLK